MASLNRQSESWIVCRGTSVIRKSGLLEPYRGKMPRALWQP